MSMTDARPMQKDNNTEPRKGNQKETKDINMKKLMRKVRCPAVPVVVHLCHQVHQAPQMILPTMKGQW